MTAALRVVRRPGGVGGRAEHEDATERDRDRAALTAFVAEVVSGTDVRVGRHCPHCGADDHGRPVVTGTVVPAWASLARTEGALALAVSVDGPVGVDVERVSRVAAAPLDAYAPEELGAIAAHDRPDVVRAVLWAGKEAVLKADGRGLRVDPRAVPLRWVGEELVGEELVGVPGVGPVLGGGVAAAVSVGRVRVQVDGDLVVVVAEAPAVR